MHRLLPAIILLIFLCAAGGCSDQYSQHRIKIREDYLRGLAGDIGKLEDHRVQRLREMDPSLKKWWHQDGTTSGNMIQCSQCEYFVRGPAGQVGFKCDPLSTIKEPECLIKWQFMRSNEMTRKLDRLVAAYEATLEIYKRLQPLQEKMFRHMEQEIEDVEDADSWKRGLDEDAQDNETDDDNDKRNGGETGPYTP
jgi:hypothetical protein